MAHSVGLISRGIIWIRATTLTLSALSYLYAPCYNVDPGGFISTLYVDMRAQTGSTLQHVAYKYESADRVNVVARCI